MMKRLFVCYIALIIAIVGLLTAITGCSADSGKKTEIPEVPVSAGWESGTEYQESTEEQETEAEVGTETLEPTESLETKTPEVETTEPGTELPKATEALETEASKPSTETPKLTEAPEMEATEPSTETPKATEDPETQATEPNTESPKATEALETEATEPSTETPKATEAPETEATEPATEALRPTEAPKQEETEPNEGQINASQDVSGILQDALTQLAAKITEPSFGTLTGEWTVLCLARGGYFQKNDPYFEGYYSRIVETVKTEAAKINQNGALHKAKSTENSRLIVALSAIGKDATSVGGWNLITPYDNFTWIKKQGINGPIWALIALDSGNYQTQDSTIRQQCIDYILGRQLEDGGWALTGKVSDPDITAMTLQALYPYRDQAAVKAVADEGFACLSALQKESGGYSTFGDENSESCAQVIVACATWGINPDTDIRFVKNEVSVLDSLLSHYVESEAGFKHIHSGKVDAMATDQGCYALVAYQRYITGQNSLYDMRDVTR